MILPPICVTRDLVAFSFAVDESKGSDTAQLSVFVRAVDSNLCVMEELLGLKSTTTGREIFEEVSKSVTEMKLPWDEVVGLMKDGAPASKKWTGGQDSGEENCAGTKNQPKP